MSPRYQFSPTQYAILTRYRPDTTDAILRQLNTTFLIIPDEWKAQSIPVGHTINKAEYLFSLIKPEKEQEWREQFGGEEARKAKDEKAAKAAAKKAEKERKKARKATKTEDGATDTAKENQPVAAEKIGQSVEAAEKGGQGEIPASGTVVEEVEKGVGQISLQTS